MVPPSVYAWAVPPTLEMDNSPVAPTLLLAPTPIKKAQALPPISAFTVADPAVTVLAVASFVMYAAELMESRFRAMAPATPAEPPDAPTARSTDMKALFCRASTTSAPLEWSSVFIIPASADSPPRDEESEV